MFVSFAVKLFQLVVVVVGCCSKLVELAKPTEWSLQGTVNDEVLPIKVGKKGDIFEVNMMNDSHTICLLIIYIRTILLT